MTLIDFVSQKEKRSFLDLAEHKLKGPLGAVRWSLEILKSSLNTPEEIQSATDIYNLNLNMISFVSDFFLIEKMREGKLTEKRSEINLEMLIGTLKEDFNKLAKAKNINLEFDINLGDKNIIEADESLLKRVFENLISNAMKFSKNGQNIKIILKFEDNNYLFSVRDEGLGIPDGEGERIGELFYRASNTGSNAIIGSGTGLAIVKALLKGWGGELSFESKENEGSEFTVKFPSSLQTNNFELEIYK